MSIATFLDRIFNVSEMTFYLNDKLTDIQIIQKNDTKEIKYFTIEDNRVVRLYID